MQGDGIWLSVGLGIGLGLVYLAASYLSNRRAMRSRRNALLIVVGAMAIRILLALLALVAILLLLPVAPVAFMGSFFVMFIFGLALEVWVLHSQEVPDANSGS